MRSSTTHRAPAAGLLLLALTLTACSSPTPSRPQDNVTPAAGDASSDNSGAPSSGSGSGFRTDPISGGEAVWNEMYGTEAPPETLSPDQPYPRPTDEPRLDDSPYPGPGTDTGDADDAEATPTAVPTTSGG